MTDTSLAAYVKRRLDLGKDSHSELTDVRSDITRRYFGRLLGNEQEDQSSFVTREIMETVEWCLPTLVRGFLGTPNAVRFEPTNSEDEDLAEQESDVVNYKLLRANNGDGFQSLYVWMKEALLYPTAYCKVCVEEKEQSFVYEMREVPADKLAELLEDEDIEILEQESRTVEIEVPVPMPPPQMGEEMQGQQPPQQMGGEEQMVKVPIEVFDIKYRETKVRTDIVVTPVPGEDIFVDEDLVTTNLDHANFVAHRVRRPYTELVQMGYDKEKLDEVSPAEESVWNEERVSRRFYEDEYPGTDVTEEDPSMVIYEVYECFLWVDFTGSGEAQFRRVVVIEDTVFENEEVAYQPLVAMSSSPFPHKLNGLSLAQMVEPLQQLSTELHRQALNNLYRVNTQRMYISEEIMLEGDLTKNALENRRAGYIPVRGVPHEGIMPEPISPMVGEVLPVIQHVAQMNARRSGVAPDQAMDQSVNQNSPYSSMMGALEAAGERMELLARVFAETGFKQLFRKAHYLCRAYPDMVETVKLRGKWVDVDASAWKERTDVSVNVGLGFNSKQQMTVIATQLLEIVQQAAPQGLADAQGGFNALKEWIDAAGIKNPEMFFIDPNSPEFQPPQPPPDPNLIMAEAQSEALQREGQRQDMELQHKMQMEQQEAQLDMQKAQMEQQRMMFEQHKLEADVEKMRADAAAKQMDAEMKRQQMAVDQRESELREREMELQAAKIPVDIDDTIAATELKEAQALKTMMEVDKTDAEVDKVDAEADKLDAEARATMLAGAEAVTSDADSNSDSGGSS